MSSATISYALCLDAPIVKYRQNLEQDQLDLPEVWLLAQELSQDLIGMRGALLAGRPLVRLVPIDFGEDVEEAEVDLAVFCEELLPVVVGQVGTDVAHPSDDVAEAFFLGVVLEGPQQDGDGLADVGEEDDAVVCRPGAVLPPNDDKITSCGRE